MSTQQQAPRTCERILACRRVRDVDQYLVKFVGASLSQSVWLLGGDLDPDVVTQYRILAKLDRPAPGKPPAAESIHGGEGKEEKRIDPEQPLQPAVNDEEDDDSWRWPSTDGAASVTRLTPFVFDPKAEPPSWLATPPREAAISAIRPSELLPAEHCRALTDAYMAWRKSPMVVPASSLFRTTATVRLPRARTLGAERLGLSNAGYPRAHLSLQMYAYEEVCRGFFGCLESGRKLGAERRYQLVAELRTLTWHLASCIRQNLDAVPSAALVEGLLAEASKEKRAAARKREHIDADGFFYSFFHSFILFSFIHSFVFFLFVCFFLSLYCGRARRSGQVAHTRGTLKHAAPRPPLPAAVTSVVCLSIPQDQEVLSAAIKTYFNTERLNPTVLPSDDDAWQAQGHLILHLLNDSCVAVPRSELLGSLIRGSSFDWDKDRGQWAMKVRVSL
jgi:hypothetical protein